MELKLQTVTPHCGALVVDLDLSEKLTEDVVSKLEQALAAHGVLFFRDQSMTPEQQKRLGNSFGELHIHPAWPRVVQGHPEIMEIYTDETSARVAGEDWHSDVSCDAEPPLGTIFQMLEVPPSGGDTVFSNAGAAYEALSPPVQRFLEGLTAVHDGGVYRGRYQDQDDSKIKMPRSEHPLVRTHPVNGRRVIFVNRIFTTHIVELEKSESDAVLEMLYQHIARQEFQCRFNWQAGSVAFWDNRCAQHYAIWDYYPHRRHGMRVTIKGDAPFFRP